MPIIELEPGKLRDEIRMPLFDDEGEDMMGMGSGRPAQVEIKAAANGFIVRVIDYGMSELKEPYEKGEYVFIDYGSMDKFLKKIFVKKESK